MRHFSGSYRYLNRRGFRDRLSNSLSAGSIPVGKRLCRPNPSKRDDRGSVGHPRKGTDALAA
jgi:hypothetical protein